MELPNVDPARDVAVIIPSTNRVAMLRTALESVSRQTAVDRVCDVLVSENTTVAESVAAVCAEFSDRLPIRFVHRNPTLTALEHGKTLFGNPTPCRYVAILHDDDWWSPEHLMHALTAIETTGSVACYTSFFDVEGESAPLRSDNNLMFWFGCGFPPMTTLWQVGREEMLMACLTGTPGRYSTLVVQREALIQASTRTFSSGNPFDNDRMLSVVLTQEGGVVFNPAPSAYIRMHAAQDCRSFSSPQINARMSATTRWLLDEARSNSIDFMAAFRRRIESCSPIFLPRVLELMQLPWVHEPLRNRAGLPAAVTAVWKQIDDARLHAHRLYLERTRAWKTKLSAAVGLIRSHRESALREILEVVKLVQGCDDPGVTLEALLEICGPLAEVDCDRAGLLADIAAKLAHQLHRTVDVKRAESLATQLRQRPRQTAKASTPVCA